jgi:hypothetical protein
MKMEVEVLLLAGFADEFGDGGWWWDLPWLPFGGGGGAASLGPTVVFLLHVFLFGCPSSGLRSVAVHAQDPPMVAVVLRRASGSWCSLGSPLLNDDAMMPPQPANRFDRPWRISQSRFVLRFGTR